jgi:hypothetical protein
VSNHSSSEKPNIAADRPSESGSGRPAKWLRYAPPWAIPAITLLIAATLFALALSGEVYDATTPPGFRILPRKIESIVAFALVGFLINASMWRRPLAPAALAAIVAVYSAAIEIAQRLVGSRESLLWNAIDIACGAAGGVLGAWIFARTSGFESPRD